MSKVLSAIDIASHYLQSKEAESQLAVDYLPKAKQAMSVYRNQFNEVKDALVVICSTWGLSENLRRNRFVK